MKRTNLKDRNLPNYTKGEEIMNMTSHIVGGAIGICALVQEAAAHHLCGNRGGYGQGGGHRPDGQAFLARRPADHRGPDRPVLPAGGGLIWINGQRL